MSSFVNLLETKRFDQITVKELVLGAELTRSTFYNHYRNLEDFTENLKTRIFDELENLINDHTSSQLKQDNGIIFFTKLFEFFAENPVCLYFLMNENGPYKNFIHVLLKNKFATDWSILLPAPIWQKEYALSYYLSTIDSFFKVWLKRDLRESPQRSAEMLAFILSSGVTFTQKRILSKKNYEA